MTGVIDFLRAHNLYTQVQNMSETLAKKQFGILMGHQYGFCYLPYPSFVPVRYVPEVRPALVSSNAVLRRFVHPTSSSFSSSVVCLWVIIAWFVLARAGAKK
jgi:hypothetical protein